MEFGSDYVYHYDDMEYEYISDEELEDGMNVRYRISSDIRQTFFSFQNNPKDLDPSYKTDLDL